MTSPLAAALALGLLGSPAPTVNPYEYTPTPWAAPQWIAPQFHQYRTPDRTLNCMTINPGGMYPQTVCQ